MAKLSPTPSCIDVDHEPLIGIPTSPAHNGVQLIECHGALVHGITQRLASVTADDDTPLLHHEPSEEPGVAANNQRAPLHGNACPGTGVSPDKQLPTAHGRPSRGPGVAGNSDFTAHHVVADGPASIALDHNLGAVEQACRIVSDTTRKAYVAVLEYTDSQIVASIGVENGDLVPRRRQLLKADVECPRVQFGSVYSNQVMTSLF